MQPTSRKVFIAFAVLLVVVALALAVAYFAIPSLTTSNDQSQATATSNAFIQSIKSEDTQSSYAYLSEDVLSYGNWVVWVDTYKQSGVDIELEPSVEPLNGDPPSYRLTYQAGPTNHLVLTLTKTDSDTGWIVSEFGIVSV